jgi:hypothetical protein
MASSIFSRKNGLRYAALASVAALGMVGVSANSFAASANSTAEATVIKPIAITNTAGLKFGTFSVGATGGTVVVDTAGSRTVTGDVLLSNTTAGAAASFDVTGNAGSTYAITLPTADVIIKDGATTPNTMIVNTFTSNPSGTGTIGTGGSQALAVGATLKVGANQVQAAYTGTFSATVEYN